MPNSKTLLRFAVMDSEGKRAASWNLSTSKPPDSELYLSHRELSSASIKVSFHQSGVCHLHTRHNGITAYPTRWKKPEPKGGFVPLIHVLSLSPPNVIDPHLNPSTVAIPAMPKGSTVEVQIIQTASGVEPNSDDDFPGKKAGWHCIGKFRLPNGTYVFVIHNVVEMPDFAEAFLPKRLVAAGKGIAQKFPDDVRGFFVADHDDGSKTLIDARMGFQAEPKPSLY